ncbi:MAG: AAA family ATPase [Clostridia bacterium]|nr:AAA family ATPase [Clostridia bacterium]
MIILITGASHTGKTLLAQKLLEKYQYPYISIDHIKMGLIRSGKTSLTPYDDGEMTDYIWPVIREIIKTAVENGQNLIVEGCYIPRDWEKDFTEEYRDKIRFYCLVMTVKYILSHFKDIKEHACVIEQRIADEDFNIETVLAENRMYYEVFSGEEGLVLIEKDFDEALKEVVSHFEKSK